MSAASLREIIEWLIRLRDYRNIPLRQMHDELMAASKALEQLAWTFFV